jgi:hypothetical protein
VEAETCRGINKHNENCLSAFIGYLSHVVGLPPPCSGNPTTCDSCSAIPNEAFADSFQKLYEHCQPCAVKDDDYFEGQ